MPSAPNSPPILPPTTPFVHALSPSLRTASHPFSNTHPECPNSPLVRHTNGDDLGSQKWPHQQNRPIAVALDAAF